MHHSNYTDNGSVSMSFPIDILDSELMNHVMTSLTVPPKIKELRVERIIDCNNVKHDVITNDEDYIIQYWTSKVLHKKNY